MQRFIFLRQMKNTVCSFIQQPASYIIRYCQRHREIQMICLRAPCIIRAEHDSVRMSLQFGLNSLSHIRCHLYIRNGGNIKHDVIYIFIPLKACLYIRIMAVTADKGDIWMLSYRFAYGKIGCILWAVFIRMEQHWHIICFSKRINRLQYIVWQIKRLMSAKQLDSYNFFSDRAVSSSLHCSL